MVENGKSQNMYMCNIKSLPKGNRKIQACSGSYICKSETCLFYLQYGTFNKSFVKYSAEVDGFVCIICDNMVDFIPCEAF